MNGKIDREAIAALGPVLRAVLATADVTTAVCAVETWIANLLTVDIDQGEADAIDGARAIASDIENCIRERFATKGRAN